MGRAVAWHSRQYIAGTAAWSRCPRTLACRESKPTSISLSTRGGKTGGVPQACPLVVLIVDVGFEAMSAAVTRRESGDELGFRFSRLHLIHDPGATEHTCILFFPVHCGNGETTRHRDTLGAVPWSGRGRAQWKQHRPSLRFPPPAFKRQETPGVETTCLPRRLSTCFEGVRFGQAAISADSVARA